jgi:hypothetical protein
MKGIWLVLLALSIYPAQQDKTEHVYTIISGEADVFIGEKRSAMVIAHTI